LILVFGDKAIDFDVLHPNDQPLICFLAYIHRYYHSLQHRTVGTTPLVPLLIRLDFARPHPPVAHLRMVMELNRLDGNPNATGFDLDYRPPRSTSVAAYRRMAEATRTDTKPANSPLPSMMAIA